MFYFTLKIVIIWIDRRFHVLNESKESDDYFNNVAFINDDLNLLIFEFLNELLCMFEFIVRSEYKT